MRLEVLLPVNIHTPSACQISLTTTKFTRQNTGQKGGDSKSKFLITRLCPACKLKCIALINYFYNLHLCTKTFKVQFLRNIWNSHYGLMKIIIIQITNIFHGKVDTI